jgi:integrase/recombinase XerC/integrase/recombinase XerD
MKIETLIHDYLMIVKLKHAQGTFKFYQNHLGHFLNYCITIHIFEVDEVSDQVITDYIGVMKSTNENVTINKNIGCLKRMYKRMNIEFDYLQSIEKLKERSKSFDTLERENFMKLRKYIREYPIVTTNGIYYKCFLALLADTGARIQEIMYIEKKNINLECSEILLTFTKTKEYRVDYLSDKF